jgi:uncharacterized protein (TIGR03435 family)
MDWQIKGDTPGWVDFDLWDVEGRARAADVDADRVLKYFPRISDSVYQSIDKNKFAKHAKLLLMLQTLLEDRFKLRAEWQTRQAPVYNLVVEKDGPKIKPGGAEDVPLRWKLQPGGMISSRQCIEGRAVPIEKLIASLLSGSGRPIVDRTNLKGVYTFWLQWSEEDPGFGNSPLARTNTSFGPAFFTALQEQLGLRLESAKGPVEYLVIRSVQKPEGN